MTWSRSCPLDAASSGMRRHPDDARQPALRDPNRDTQSVGEGSIENPTPAECAKIVCASRLSDSLRHDSHGRSRCCGPVLVLRLQDAHGAFGVGTAAVRQVLFVVYQT